MGIYRNRFTVRQTAATTLVQMRQAALAEAKANPHAADIILDKFDANANLLVTLTTSEPAADPVQMTMAFLEMSPDRAAGAVHRYLDRNWMLVDGIGHKAGEGKPQIKALREALAERGGQDPETACREAAHAVMAGTPASAHDAIVAETLLREAIGLPGDDAWRESDNREAVREAAGIMINLLAIDLAVRREMESAAAKDRAPEEDGMEPA